MEGKKKLSQDLCSPARVSPRTEAHPQWSSHGIFRSWIALCSRYKPVTRTNMTSIKFHAVWHSARIGNHFLGNFQPWIRVSSKSWLALTRRRGISYHSRRTRMERSIKKKKEKKRREKERERERGEWWIDRRVSAYASWLHREHPSLRIYGRGCMLLRVDLLSKYMAVPHPLARHHPKWFLQERTKIHFVPARHEGRIRCRYE